MENSDITRPTKLFINKENAIYNIEQIQNFVGKDILIMPVIKASAYGTYLNTDLDFLNRFEIVAVATVDEGAKIRNVGYKKDIFILNQPYETEIDKIIENDLTIGISSDSFIESLGNKLNELKVKQIKVHIEIGTGMGRTGINPNRVNEYVEKVQSFKNIIIDGIYTHLSSADIDPEYTRKQLDSFDRAIETIKKKVDSIRFIHAQASTGILNFNEKKYNLVRPGLIIYGIYPDDTFKNKIKLKPVITKFSSRITLLKKVPVNFSIGYSRSYITKRNTTVATVPIGYADGLRRLLSNNYQVLVNGYKVPIIGNICMDSFMIDVTDIENDVNSKEAVRVGDEVIIFDNEKITLEEYSEKSKEIVYEAMCTISDRVPRVYL